MKQTIDVYGFRRAFERTDRKDQFSYEGLKALFDWLEEYEEGTGDEVELDVIALCCEFTEYESLFDFQKDYGKTYQTIDDIEERTGVIRIEDGDSFIIQQF